MAIFGRKKSGQYYRKDSGIFSLPTATSGLPLTEVPSSKRAEEFMNNQILNHLKRNKEADEKLKKELKKDAERLADEQSTIEKIQDTIDNGLIQSSIQASSTSPQAVNVTDLPQSKTESLKEDEKIKQLQRMENLTDVAGEFLDKFGTQATDVIEKLEQDQKNIIEDEKKIQKDIQSGDKEKLKEDEKKLEEHKKEAKEDEKTAEETKEELQKGKEELKKKTEGVNQTSTTTTIPKGRINLTDEQKKDLQDESFREALVIMLGDEGVDILARAKAQGVFQ